MGVHLYTFPSQTVSMKLYNKMVLDLIFLMFSFPLAIHGHGNMMLPTPWMDPGGKIGLRNQMNCGGAFSSCLWFTNYTFIPGKSTLDPSLWTYPKIRLHNEPVFNPHDLDYTGCKQQVTKMKEDPQVRSNDIPPLKDYFYNHPWRSPGIKHGQYVLSFRWDCEQTPQVWTA